jgi:hypothetical protein
MMNKVSIVCGIAGTMKKTEARANNNDKTEKP